MDASPRPTARIRWSGGEVTLASDALVGRSPVAALRIDDPRVSTVHAELSWRDAGLVLLARGGRLVVGGRATREVVLAPGLVVELAPGLSLEVVAVTGGGQAPVPPTAGRERLRFVLGPGFVSVGTGAEPACELTGVPGRLVAALLAGPRERPWDALAEALWPDEGALRAATRAGVSRDWTDVDERRLRNRFDQHLRTLRKELAGLRGGSLVELQGGVVHLRLGPHDVIEQAQSA